MREIRLHGRGGQGVVVAAKVLAQAFFEEGYEVQTFPSFGAERRGAPVVAFLRMGREAIYERCGLYHPDDLLVLDQMIPESVDVSEGLKENGFVVINSRRPSSAYSNLSHFRVVTFDCDQLAEDSGLGGSPTPIVNTVILGAFAKITGLVKMESVARGIDRWVPVRPKDNIEAAWAAYELARPYSRM